MTGLWNWIFSRFEEKKTLPVQIDGRNIGYITLEDWVVPFDGMFVNGKMAKVVWVPDRVINLVMEKKDEHDRAQQPPNVG